jgi:hypothetical protein
MENAREQRGSTGQEHLDAGQGVDGHPGVHEATIRGRPGVKNKGVLVKVPKSPPEAKVNRPDFCL